MQLLLRILNLRWHKMNSEDTSVSMWSQIPEFFFHNYVVMGSSDGGRLNFKLYIKPIMLE